MNTAFTSVTSIDINTTADHVWEALTTPDMIKQYMFGATVVSDWKVSSAIIYQGEWEGRPYEDKGTILAIEPNRYLQATYYSALSGLEDIPENYNTITYEFIADTAGKTRLIVTQTNNPDQDTADQAKANWDMVINTIKTLLEQERSREASTNYYNTFIEVADDCRATVGLVPVAKGAEKTMPVLQYEMIANHPYIYTQADVLFETYAEHKHIPADDRPEERTKFFTKDQPCLRASALGKRYGWGIHCDANGKVALVAREAPEYEQFANDPQLKHLKAMRSKRG